MVGAMMLMKILHCKRKFRKKRDKTPSPLYVEVGEGDPGSSNSIDVKIERINPEYDQNLCRVCLKEGCIPIFGLNNLSEDLATFAAIEVTEFDSYPKYLCASCSALLEGAILFRRTAQESDRSLRNSELGFSPKSPAFGSDNDIDAQDYTLDDLSYSYHEENAKYEEKVKVIKEKDELKINLDEREAVRGKSFHCRLCNLYFKTIEEYAEHRLTVGHDTKRETCPICNKTYNSMYFKNHLALHRKESPYMCDICGKKFKVQNQFSRHRLTHFIDDLPFKCPQCPYRGRFNESLRLHMRTHTGEKPYQCPQCPTRAFVNRSNLNKHLLTHKTEYDFQCDQCHRGFFKKRDLELHFKVDHSGIKDHVCNLCGKAFGYRKQMMKHQLKVHKRNKMRSGRTPLYVIQETKKKLEETVLEPLPLGESIFG